MKEIGNHQREARRLMRLADEASTEAVRQILLRHARQYEAAAFQLEIVALRDDVENLMP